MINSVKNNLQILNGSQQKEKTNNSGTSFLGLLKNNINKANQLQLNADQITEDFALGKVDNIHDVTIATEKAKLALNLTVAVQSKVMSAYQEIMRMQI